MFDISKLPKKHVKRQIKEIDTLGKYYFSAIAASLTLALTSGAAQADGDDASSDENKIENVYVFGEQGKTDTATKLNLTLFETPQTVTAISRIQMDDFALNSINDVLEYTPGVTVEKVETDRTYYTARGFDIVNFQYDGVGVPFVSGLNVGQQDSAIYEKVEVVKGAAGLITGLANPSATINYVRKRPTEDLRVSTRLAVNEWNGYRADGDIAGAFSSAARGRLVVVREDSESYLDRNENQTNVIYGVTEFDLGEQTLLTVGHSYDKSDASGVLWGALPLLYSDGTRTDYDVSTSNAPDWTFTDNTQNQTFVELKHELNSNWTFNTVYTRNETDFESELFYVYGTPDPEDETGLNGHASAYDRKEEQNIYDIFVTGSFAFGGREHQLAFGYSHSDTQIDEASFSDNIGGFPVLGGDWAQGNTPHPNFVDHDPATETTDIELTQKALYLSSRLSVTERFSLLLGARRAELTQEGIQYGGSADTDAKKTVPYFGATYLLADDLMLYGSYSEVFKQQTWVNDQFQPMGPTEGESTEIGIKKSFNDERAVLTVAMFQANHANLGEFVGRDPDTGTAFYEPREFESDGYEVEFSGELAEGFNLGAGFTKVNLEDTDGDEVRPYVPSKLLKLSASYRLPILPALKIGGVVKWQDTVTTADELVEQESYSLVDIALHYSISDNLGLALNIENVTDEKYLNSLYWDQAYYGAPRNVIGSVSWKY